MPPPRPTEGRGRQGLRISVWKRSPDNSSGQPGLSPTAALNASRDLWGGWAHLLWWLWKRTKESKREEKPSGQIVVLGTYKILHRQRASERRLTGYMVPAVTNHPSSLILPDLGSDRLIQLQVASEGSSLASCALC